MTSTKQVTQGAMFLGIYGALLLLNKQIGGLFSDMCPILISASLIAIGRNKNVLKYIFSLAVGYLTLSLLFGDLKTYIYAPAGILVAICTIYAIRKYPSGREVLLALFLSYLASELLICFILYPVLGINLQTQMQGMIDILNKFNTGFAFYLALFGFVGTIIIVSIVESLLTVLAINVINKTNN